MKATQFPIPGLSQAVCAMAALAACFTLAAVVVAQAPAAAESGDKHANDSAKNSRFAFRFNQEPAPPTSAQQQPAPRGQLPPLPAPRNTGNSGNNDLRGSDNGGLDPLPDASPAPSGDPTQSPPDVRRILEGEPDQSRREPLPAIEVVGKVLQSNGRGKALLRINERYLLIGEGMRFSVGSQAAAVVYTVQRIDEVGVEVVSSEDNQMLRLP